MWGRKAALDLCGPVQQTEFSDTADFQFKNYNPKWSKYYKHNSRTYFSLLFRSVKLCRTCEQSISLLQEMLALSLCHGHQPQADPFSRMLIWFSRLKLTRVLILPSLWQETSCLPNTEQLLELFFRSLREVEFWLPVLPLRGNGESSTLEVLL